MFENASVKYCEKISFENMSGKIKYTINQTNNNNNNKNTLNIAPNANASRRFTHDRIKNTQIQWKF